MNYQSYIAEPSPAELTLPSDGSATPIALNPAQGVQRSSAVDPNAPVTIQGVQMSAAQARELGFMNEPEAQEASVPSEAPVDAPEASPELPEDAPDSVLEEGTAEALNGLLSERGDVAMSAINSILESNELSQENVSDIANATGLSMEQASEAFGQVTTHLDNVLDGQSSLLSLAAETDSAATKSAIVSALHGSPEEAMRIIASTQSTMDTSSEAEALVEALEADGFKVTFQNGRAYLQGNQFPVPQPWSRVYNQFDMPLI